MRKLTGFLAVLLCFLMWPSEAVAQGWWKVQSVDTMKYSRDLARIKTNDPDFLKVIDTQVKNIAAVGATHIAVGTPYDSEFLPFLKEWVAAARRYNLKVWFRGNWSGWEGWFSYPAITRDQHLQKTTEFINENKDLFVSGDIFTACPECENGGPGDPRRTGDTDGFRSFMIAEHQAARKAFAQNGLEVATNYASMNGDVARLIMDTTTTASMGGVVVIDHYVKSPERLVTDIEQIAGFSGGQVILGEFGVPLPDIHGSMNQNQQAEWIKSTLSLVSRQGQVSGINYWVNVGGTTQLWTASGTALPGAEVLKSYYHPATISITVRNEIGQSLAGAKVGYRNRIFESGSNGEVTVPINPDTKKMSVTLTGYDRYLLLSDTSQTKADVVLKKTHEGLIFKIQKLIFKIREKI